MTNHYYQLNTTGLLVCYLPKIATGILKLTDYQMGADRFLQRPVSCSGLEFFLRRASKVL